MNSKERVLAAFEHNEADRVPCWCGASEEFWRKAKDILGMNDEELRRRLGDDFRRVTVDYNLPKHGDGDKTEHRTLFGVGREGIGYGQPTSHPLAEASLGEVEGYAWPDSGWADVDKFCAGAKYCSQEYAILGGEWSPFWHDAIDLLGMENFYIKMYTEPEVCDAVLNHIVDFYADVNERVFASAAEFIDILFIGNDFGSQTGPLLGPELFKRFIVPHLKRFADIGHSYGSKVQLHCCGGVEPLIGLMIEAGIDGLHAVQPDCHGMDLRELKRKYGEKMVFNGGVDSHHILIDGSVDLVRKSTREVLEIMKPGGGYIAGASHDTILEETPVENVLAMFDAICEFGVYN